jgi:chemotaxis protein CheD
MRRFTMRRLTMRRLAMRRLTMRRLTMRRPTVRDGRLPAGTEGPLAAMSNPTQQAMRRRPLTPVGKPAGGGLRHDLSVGSGELKACRAEGRLRANALGSCVVVAAYEPQSRVGGMAHVMLPGASSGAGPPGETKHANDAVEEMLRQMAALGAAESQVRVCLIGGANVLGEGHRSPGPEIVESLSEILARTGIPTVAARVGGTQRRSCCLNVARGRVTYTVGDSERRVLWQARTSRVPAKENGRREAPERAGGVAT